MYKIETHISIDLPFTQYENLFLTNLTTEYKVRFLNNQLNFNYSSLDNERGENILKRNYLLVSKNRKFGIYQFPEDVKYESAEKFNPQKKMEKNEKANTNQIEYSNPLKVKKIAFEYYSYAGAKATKILPIIYDSIICRDNLMFLKKDNLIGIFPLQKELKYKYMGERNNNFIEYEFPNGQKGWLDLNTGMEYNNE